MPPRRRAGDPPLAEYRRKRDFRRTSEPSGDRASPPPSGALRFVVQKHAASHLHFDFRLELDGALKSWAVPKGPSLDPAAKRLAIQVEDHPIDYGGFEGTIPAGEYGGGTVMLWDRGHYEAAGGGGERALREGYARGTLDFVLHGERLRGAWTLVRTRRGSRDKPQWLLIKRDDAFAEPGSEIARTADTSVATGRTMEGIAAGDADPPVGDAAERANTAHRAPARGRARSGSAGSAGSASRSRSASRTKAAASRRAGGRRSSTAPDPAIEELAPMLATIGEAVPTGGDWTFEPKYDGIRVIVHASPERARLVTRNGKDKAAQFPEVADAARSLAAKAGHPLVLDGEIVALDHGAPARFQELQSRMHVKDSATIAGYVAEAPSALIAFDLLAVDGDLLIDEPWAERRRRLERQLRHRTAPALRLGGSEPGDGRLLLERARRDGWEGIVAKRMDSRYEPGRRSDAWRKLKVEYRQEFVVGGWTEPRNSRQYIGALLLGYFDGDRLVYVGHTGGGFDRAGLEAMHRRLRPLERRTSPFAEPPKTNERAHWVRPVVVVEVKFSEWTADGKLRTPIFLGVRDDKPPRDVGREEGSMQREGERGTGGKKTAVPTRARGSARPGAAARQSSGDAVVARLDAIERAGGAGALRVGGGATLELSSLDKVFFPRGGYTKGDLMRYYARLSRLILPTMRDRPLVLKRTPDGIEGEAFFQQKAPEHPPAGVRVETVADGGKEMRRLIGGNLATLLYLVQLGCISIDPWLSRIRSIEDADYSVLDLDPGPRASFDVVVRVARWIGEELDALGLRAALKTSGAHGIHIVLPLPARVSYETSQLLAQLVAARVAAAHPREATLERSVKDRPAAAVYVDYLQNAAGKSVASAYCVRAVPGATVSTPLDWSELREGLDLQEFTIETVPARVASLGDLWAPAMRRRNTLRAIRAAADL